MNRERLFLFDTTLRCPFARSSEACEDEQKRASVARNELAR